MCSKEHNFIKLSMIFSKTVVFSWNGLKFQTCPWKAKNRVKFQTRPRNARNRGIFFGNSVKNKAGKVSTTKKFNKNEDWSGRSTQVP